MADWVYTLLADGPSDASLMRVIDWTLLQCAAVPVTGQFADHRALGAGTRRLIDRIPAALELFPCDMLVLHRDSERPDHAPREREVAGALEKLDLEGGPPTVVLIPVRMQEAWLLIDEAAIRRAAGCPEGRRSLPLPLARRLEDVANPKDLLAECLRIASGLTGRRLRRFSEGVAARRVSELIRDFQPLRALPACNRFETSLRGALDSLGILAPR